MENRDKNYTGHGEDNQRIGRELYDRDQDQRHPRHHDRKHTDVKWDEGNFFHTGPSKKGAQERDWQDNSYNRGGTGNKYYDQGQNIRQQQQGHYGTRHDSPYRNERSYLNHGNSYSSNDPSRYSQGREDGSAPGNYNEWPDSKDNLHREGPGSRSRYKESDYRYGSGSHNWYREGRYSPDEDRRREHDDRGFFERAGDNIRNTWNDIMHADDPDYQRRHHQPQPEKGSDRVRMGSEPYRDRQFDRGYEGGPRWADETDSGHDDQYKDSGRNRRYRS